MRVRSAGGRFYVRRGRLLRAIQAAVEARGLEKVFRTREKAPGLGASLRGLVAPRYRDVEAVAGIDLRIEPGEVLAFIGPNGAGKSTTIKMLTGILYPSAGEAHVLGLVPWRDRQKLAFKIASVFGQRSQLWYHLPPAAELRSVADGRNARVHGVQHPAGGVRLSPRSAALRIR